MTEIGIEVEISLGQKMFGSDISGVKNILGWKCFWVKKNLGRKFGLAKFYFALKRFVCVDYFKVEQKQHRVCVVVGGGWINIPII